MNQGSELYREGVPSLTPEAVRNVATSVPPSGDEIGFVGHDSDVKQCFALSKSVCSQKMHSMKGSHDY